MKIYNLIGQQPITLLQYMLSVNSDRTWEHLIQGLGKKISSTDASVKQPVF